MTCDGHANDINPSELRHASEHSPIHSPPEVAAIGPSVRHVVEKKIRRNKRPLRARYLCVICGRIRNPADLQRHLAPVYDVVGTRMRGGPA